MDRSGNVLVSFVLMPATLVNISCRRRDFMCVGLFIVIFHINVSTISGQGRNHTAAYVHIL